MRRVAVLLLLTVVLAGIAARAATPGTKTGSPRTVRLFDEGWKFHLGDVPGAWQPGVDDRGWRTLDLPHDWSIELPFDSSLASGTGFLPGGCGWYRKTFQLPASSAGKRVIVRFDGVYMNSEVWINAHYLGKRPYGYISFEYDLTPYISIGAKQNVLAVRVDHPKYADSRWYTGSGIYRHVWLTTTGDIHVAAWGTFITASKVSRQAAAVNIRTRIRNDSVQAGDVVLVSTIKDRDGKAIAAAESRQVIGAGTDYTFEQMTDLSSPNLWSPDTPNIYSLTSRLLAGGAVVDECETPFGIRTAVFDPQNGLILNGLKTVIKGVCIHHDAGSLGAAVPDRALERRLRLLKEMGCNAIRTSHNPPAPELLDYCDRMGFLVMDEAFDEWAKPKRKWIAGWNVGTPGYDGYAEYFAEWGTRDIQSMVERDKNHPCIVLWSIGNEIDYERDPYFDPEARGYTPDKPSAAELPAVAATLIKAVKEVDGSRPVTAALANISVSNRYGLADLLDVVGYNYLEKFYSQDHTRYPARKIVGSENSHSYSAWKIVEDLPYVAGQFLWTGFDYLGEARQWPARSSSAGILDECGFRKPAFYFRQSLWSDSPMVYIAVRTPSGNPAQQPARGEIVANWNWSLKTGDPVTVVAFTNCERVELFLNGKSLGDRVLSAAPERVLSWEVPYATGTLRAIAKKGGAIVASHELKTAGKAERIRLNPDAGAIAADGRDLSHVEVSLVDRDGNTDFSADNMISFELVGKGKIIGFDSGDIRSHESFKSGPRKAYQGKCLVIVQSTPESGTIRLRATSPGLAAGQVTIVTSKAARR